MSSKHYQNFTGSVDEFLNHTSQLDANQVEAEVDGKSDPCLPDEDLLDMIVEDYKVTPEEARILLDEIKLEEAKCITSDLMEQGMLEISSYDENGEPLFSLTEEGKKLYNQINQAKKG